MNGRWVKPEPAPCTSSRVPDRHRVREMRTIFVRLKGDVIWNKFVLEKNKKIIFSLS